jgi:peptidoglycan/LPS O-acetylase OafA/YrhL
MGRASSGRAMASGPPRLGELDGLRGCAALAVVVYHWLLVIPANMGLAAAKPFGSFNWFYATPLSALFAGPLMVLLFFVLSGMVLTLGRLEGRAQPYRRYVLRRLLRLYPAAWTAMAASLLVLALLPANPRPGLSLWVNSQLSQPLPDAWHAVGLVLPFNSLKLDAPLWSLQQEIRLSLLLPLLVLFVREVRWPALLAVSVSLFMIGTASTPVVDSWAWMPATAGCFLLGALLARHRHALNDLWGRIPRGLRWALAIAVLFAFWLPTRFVEGPVDIVAVLGSAVLIVIAQGTTTARALRARVPAWLGKISYSLYLIHVVVIHLAAAICPRGVPLIWFAPAGIALSLLLASTMQRYVEAPALSWSRSASPSAPPGASAPQPSFESA